jgi:Arc/MetJ family transcription regulator
MRTTIAIDDDLLRQAGQLSGISERNALVREGLRALVHQEASRRLAALGGSDPQLEPVKRRRADQL